MDGKPFNSASVARLLGIARPTVMSYLRSLEEGGFAFRVPLLGGHGRPLLITRDGKSRVMSVMEPVRALFPGAGLHWWRTARRRRVQLVADTPRGRIGFCVCTRLVPRRRDWLPLSLALNAGVIDRAFLLHSDTAAYIKNRRILCLPLAEFLREPEQWILRRLSLPQARETLRRINRGRLAPAAAPR